VLLLTLALDLFVLSLNCSIYLKLVKICRIMLFYLRFLLIFKIVPYFLPYF